MFRSRVVLGIVFCLFAELACQALAAQEPKSPPPARKMRRISLAEFEDQVRGGWAGQMVGVTYGAPTEFHYLQRINEDPRDWKPEELRGALDQDDLYVEMTFADVMDRLGLQATTETFGEAFRDSKYQLWHANLAARRLLRRGVKAPLSGDPRHNLHANDIDFQIESDFIGLMCPGMPRAVRRYAARVGHVMNYGDGVYGGIFMGAMYAAAFFEKDPRRVVEAGVAAIPDASEYARLIRDVLRWSSENTDWRETWRLIEEKWDKDDPCPDGALRPFDIDAKLNGGYVALGLLYGKGDFDKTIDIAMRGGQDADCNPASAGGVVGTMLGLKAIPAKWTAPLGPIAGEKFSFTNYSFNSIVRSTIERAKLVTRNEGGRVGEDALEIPAQSPAPPALEQFRPGRVAERIPLKDARWKLEGNWQEVRDDRYRKSEKAGSQATVRFEGTGAMLVGELDKVGGAARVFLDGKPAGGFDNYNDDGERGSEGLWGRFDLPAGAHTLRVEVSGKPFAGSRGAWVYLEDLIVFRKMPLASKGTRAK